MSNTHSKKRRFTRLPTLVATTAITCWTSHCFADEWRVGANLLAGTNPYVGEDGAVGLLPVLAYKGERFHANLGNPGLSFFRGSIDIGGIGYSLLKEEHYQIDLVGRLRGMGLDPDDDDELAGLDERKPGLDAGVSLLWEVGMGELNMDLLADVTHRSKGQEVLLSYAYPLTRGGWTLRPEVGVSWASSNLTDYYFGVDRDEVRADRPAYEADAAVTPFVGVELEYVISKQTSLLGGVGYGRLGDGINDSPIVDERGVGGGYLGLTYSF